MEANTEKGVKAQNVDMIQKIMGSFGRYQLIVCILLFLTNFPIAFHLMAIMFLAPRTPYTCAGSNETDTCPCAEPMYDNSVFTETIISQWDLICENRWLSSFAQTFFQLGTLVGSVLFGMAADKFGRKNPLLLSIVAQAALGVGAAYAPDYWTFTIIRFFVGMTIGGMMVIGFVIIMEMVGTKYRDVISAVYQIPFNIGHLLLAVFGYFIRDYAMFQLAISAPTILLFVYFFTIPETPRWLLMVKRTDEAVVILEKMAKANGRPVENVRQDVETYQTSVEKDDVKEGSIVDLFRYPNLRKNIIAMSFNWLSCGYCFYGVSQYVSQLSGDIFVNVALSASVTLVGTIVSIPLLKVIGRRTIIIVFNFLCAGCLIILALIPEGTGSVIFASIGVVTSFVVLVVVYLACCEMFPTAVRTAALGFSSMASRIGSMVAPFVIDLQLIAPWLPPIVFAIIPFIAGFISFLMPETKGCELMTTIEEGEQLGKKVKSKDEKAYLR